jgi:shikimate dehydrogenase
MSKDALNRLRQDIETLDRKLLRLLNERAAVSLQIGEFKVREGLDIRDPWREQAVFEYLTRYNKGPLKTGEIEEIFRKIMSISRKIQSAASLSGSKHSVESADVDTSFAVTGKTALYGIIGNPVAQSMSPLMHNTAFRLLDINAIYLPFEVEDLPGALTGMKALNVKGASVTHPFKRQILGLIDDIDDTAAKIGAVNTLSFGKDGIQGTNTDWVGAVRCLETLLPIEGHTFVVIGAGGAARAVVFGITGKGGNVIVVNRSEEKGRALAEAFDCAFAPLSEIESVGGDCLVNTTPVGMDPKTDVMPVPKGVLGAYKAVADVIYNPLETMLLKEAKATGCQVASGFHMFVYQGVEQFSIWTARMAPVKEMEAAVYERLSRT